MKKNKFKPLVYVLAFMAVLGLSLTSLKETKAKPNNTNLNQLFTITESSKACPPGGGGDEKCPDALDIPNQMVSSTYIDCYYDGVASHNRGWCWCLAWHDEAYTDLTSSIPGYRTTCIYSSETCAYCNTYWEESICDF